MVFLSCTEDQLSADSVIQKSIEAHGGEALWNQVSTITYTKNTRLFTPTKVLEEEISQKISHAFHPFYTTLEWENSEGHFYANNRNETTVLLKNQTRITDSLFLKQTKTTLDAALYVFWQPIKLLDPLARKEYLGKQLLLDSIEVHSVKISYSDDPNADLWHYYFSTKNFKLRAVKVEHNHRSSLIINESYETKTGLSLNNTRKSYFLDTLNQIEYLRASYDYEILEVLWR